MQVNHSVRRIASLSAFMLAVGMASVSQAGIIPWAYDAIFGPVRYPAYGYGYGYSPYQASYGRPVVIRSSRMYAPAPYGYSYAPASGCSSCSTSYYAPVSYSVPSYGCGPVVMAPSCGPCGATVASAPSASGCLSGCSISPASATSEPVSKQTWNSTKKEPEARNGASTIGAKTDDGLDTSIRKRGKAETGETFDGVNRPASGEVGPKILKKTPAKATDVFETPLENDKPLDDAKKTEGEATLRLPLPKVNLDGKIAWRTEPQRTRVPFHANAAKASVTRRAVGVDSDWTPVIAKSTATQLAKK